MSTSLDAVSGSANNPSSQQVPLDTIPISPAGPNGTTQNGNDMKENQDPNGSSSGGANADKDEQITIFHDKDNFNVKHPLIHEWTLWFTKPPSGKVSVLLHTQTAVYADGHGKEKSVSSGLSSLC